MISIFNGVMTGVLIVIFLGIWVWAWSSRNKSKFDYMAQLPLETTQETSGVKEHD